jgi:hypothetical protein
MRGETVGYGAASEVCEVERGWAVSRSEVGKGVEV